MNLIEHKDRCVFYLSSTREDGERENPVLCPIKYCNGEKYQLDANYKIMVCPCFYGDEDGKD